MAKMRRSGEVEARVAAAPSHVYGVVSDVTRTGEWSPECYRCEWVEGATGPAVGARFRGWNRWGRAKWDRLVEVVAAEPGREFAFRTLPEGINRDSTTWRFVLEEADGGSRIVQSYEIHTPPRFPINIVQRLFLKHHIDMRPHMEEALRRIKEMVEAPDSEKPAP